jgi:prolyl-tRNA editing enzyme YbaK/EbsC (Cys-tRNA(Pro) deacylase)
MNPFGTLTNIPVIDHLNLVAEPTAAFLRNSPRLGEACGVTEIDPAMSDTAAFCEKYQIGPEQCANCVVVKATRGDKVWYAACMILGNDRADVNGLARRHLGARKVSFAPMEEAVALTGMEYGGITPVGLPADWPILVDGAVAASERVIIGSGIRKSKLVIFGKILPSLPGAVILEGLGTIKL